MKAKLAPAREKTIRDVEKEWHENLFRSRRTTELGWIFPDVILNRYLYPPKKPLFQREELFRLTGDVRGKNVLVFGCGDENSPVILALKGANVLAFDLSEEAVGIQRRLAAANGVNDRVRTMVCAAEEISFGAGQFDLVFGSAILHHIPDHLPMLPPKLRRILKPDGLAVFSEPVIRSDRFKRIMDALPFHGEVSPGERQLVDEDFDHFRKYFDLEFSYFGLLSRLDRFILRTPLETAPVHLKALVYTLHGCDYAMFNLLGLKRLAGAAVIAMRPKLSW